MNVMTKPPRKGKQPAIGETGWRPSDVHPAAALFPMMPDDELAQLASDIKDNGLIHPIVIDVDGLLIDGRNRLAACELAEVEPTFSRLNGQDAIAYIVSANLTRRNLSKGQQAMALAMIYPEPTPGKRSDARRVLESQRLSDALFSQARAILRHSAEMAQDVLTRGTHFDVALKLVREGEQRRRAHDHQMNDLRIKAPDIAAMVDDGRLTLTDGCVEMAQRQRQVTQTLESARSAAAKFAGLTPWVTVIKSVRNLTPQDFLLIGVDQEDADPLAELERDEIVALAGACDDLLAMKDAAEGEE